MSPRTGRPTQNKKTERLEIRMTLEESQLLNECAERLHVSKTEVLNKGVQLVKKELDEKKINTNCPRPKRLVRVYCTR